MKTILFALLALVAVDAWSSSPNKVDRRDGAADIAKPAVSRSAFVAGMVGMAAATAAGPTASWAAGAKMQSMDSKLDEEKCIKTCVTECTQKGQPRDVCSPQCLTKCSKDKKDASSMNVGGQKLAPQSYL